MVGPVQQLLHAHGRADKVVHRGGKARAGVARIPCRLAVSFGEARKPGQSACPSLRAQLTVPLRHVHHRHLIHGQHVEAAAALQLPEDHAGPWSVAHSVYGFCPRPGQPVPLAIRVRLCKIFPLGFLEEDVAALPVHKGRHRMVVKLDHPGLLPRAAVEAPESAVRPRCQLIPSQGAAGFRGCRACEQHVAVHAAQAGVRDVPKLLSAAAHVERLHGEVVPPHKQNGARVQSGLQEIGLAVIG
mmetsp:Transcript_7719/g.21965  ORF Transcript_7719/g.21965 Transcript_7719/m.21965 type:complete len:243 (-) Transcript_7719:759-1487(-)